LKTLNPAQLSESVRARLQEHTLGRHASNLPAPEVRPRHETPSEPLRRGLARQRRVQAVETAEGVTVISNRLELPEPRLASMARRQPKPVEVAPEEEHELEVANASHPESVTETHSLRAMTARPAKAKLDAGTGLGWLIWPFVLFVTTGAVVATLWFRKKTS
jgi:hypothetical protein